MINYSSIRAGDVVVDNIGERFKVISKTRWGIRVEDLQTHNKEKITVPKWMAEQLAKRIRRVV